MLNGENLPASLEHLAKYVLFTREKLTAVRAGIRAMDNLNVATSVRAQKQAEAQDMASALLDAEMKLGELMKGLDKHEHRLNRPSTNGSPERGKYEVIKSLGFADPEKTAHRFELLAEYPEIVERIKAQAIENDDIPTRTEVLREIRREQVETNLAQLRELKPKTLQGQYDAVVIDPPWPIEKIERDVRPNQTGLDYPGLEVWCQNPQGDIGEDVSCGILDEEEYCPPCNSIECTLWRYLTPVQAQDCHVWLWTTHRFLPEAFNLLDKLELRYVCTFVWYKPGGFQPIGLPQYNCEFALYARRGAPKFIDTKNFPVCFNAPRGAHSEKPGLFYETVRRVTHGRRLDMFNRRQIDGFDGWGKESV